MGRTPSRQVVIRILETSESVLAASGFAAVTPTTVAAAAGVSPQTIYNRFGSMEALFDDLATRGFRSLTEDIVGDPGALVTATGGPLQWPTEVLRRYRRFAMEDPHRHRFLFDGDRPWWSDRTRLVATGPVDALVAVAQRAIEAGVLLPGDPADVANRLLAAAEGAIRLELAGRGSAAEFEATVATMIRGLRPSAQVR